MAGEQIKQPLNPMDALFADLEGQIAEEAELQIRQGMQRKRKAPQWEATLQKFEEAPSESLTAKRIEGCVKVFTRKLGQEVPTNLQDLVLKMKAEAKNIESIMKKLKGYADTLSAAGKSAVTPEELLAQTEKYPALAKIRQVLNEASIKLADLKKQIKETLMPVVREIRDREAIIEAMSDEELAGWEAIFGAFSQKEKPEQERIADAEAQFLLSKKEINTRESRDDYEDFRSAVLTGAVRGYSINYKEEVQQQFSDREAAGLDLVDIYVQERVQALKMVREVSARPYRARKQDEAPATFSEIAKQATQIRGGGASKSENYNLQANEIRGKGSVIEFEARMVALKDCVWKRYMERVKGIMEEDLPGDANAEKRNALYIKLLTKPINNAMHKRDEPHLSFKEGLFLGIDEATQRKILKEYLKTAYLADLSTPVENPNRGVSLGDDQDRRKIRFLNCVALLESSDDNQISVTSDNGWTFYRLKFQSPPGDLGDSAVHKQEKLDRVKRALPKEIDFVNEIDAIFKFIAPAVSRESLYGYKSFEELSPVNDYNLTEKMFSGISKVGEARLPEDNLFMAAGDTDAIPRLREARKRFVQSLSSDLKRITGESTLITRADERQAVKQRVSKAEATALAAKAEKDAVRAEAEATVLAAKAEKDAVKAEKDALERQIRELSGQVAQLAGQTEQAQALRAQIEGQSRTNLEQVGARIQRLEAEKLELQQKNARLQQANMAQEQALQKQMEELQAALANPGIRGGNLKDAVRKFLAEQK